MSTSGGVEGRQILAEGLEAVVYEWGEGQVLRHMRDAAAGPAAARRAAASEAARLLGVATPRVLEQIEVDGRPAQVLERVDGVDLFAHIAANPLRLLGSARVLAEVHLALGQVAAPATLRSTHERLTEMLEDPLVPAQTADRALAALAELPGGDQICHGDHHPGNILMTDAGPVLIDWTGASRGDPTADFARTRLMLQIGELPPGSPAVIRAASVVGRGALWRTYARTYLRGRPVDPDLLRRWTRVNAAARLADGVEGERPALFALLGDRD